MNIGMGLAEQPDCSARATSPTDAGLNPECGVRVHAATNLPEWCGGGRHRTIPPGAAALAQGGRASVLRFVPQSDLTIVDPVTTTAYITRHHALMVFDQLYGLDAQLTPQPQMVEGHRVAEDGKLWTFRLARA